MLLRHARSNAVGYLALTVALGGTSYAAVALPARSVGPKQLKANAVTSAKVKNRTLRLKDFKVGQIPAGLAGARGLVGADGATGAVGPTYARQSSPFSQVIPSTTVDTVLATQTLSLPTAGRVFAYGHARALTITCSVGNPEIGLYIDGVGVPGSARRFATGTADVVLDFSGLSGVVAAGDRALSLGLDCPTGTVGGAGSLNSIVIGGVLVGG